QPALRLKARAARGRVDRTDPRPAAGTHYIVQFRSVPGLTERQELERRGLRVLQYVPDSALMVAGRTPPDVRGLDVLSVGTMSVADKISPVLAEPVSGALLVVFHTDVAEGVARSVVREVGFDVVETPSVLHGQLVL